MEEVKTEGEAVEETPEADTPETPTKENVDAEGEENMVEGDGSPNQGV